MRKSFICLAGLAFSGGAFLPAATFTVAAGGGGDFTTINAAVSAATAVPPAVDTIQIIETGLYAETLTIPGGVGLEIEATVAGVQVVGTGINGGWSVDPSTGAVLVTLRNFEIYRDTGTGPVFDVDQNATNTVDVTLEDMTFTSLAADPLKIDDGVGAGGAQVTISATNCIFDATNTPADRSAIRCASEVALYDNLSVTLTGCQLLANTIVSGAALRIDAFALGQVNHSWTLDGCTLTAPIDRGIEVDDAIDNFTLNVIDSTITVEQEAIIISEAADANNNDITINRSTLDNTAGALEDRLVDIRIADGQLDVYNSLFLIQEDADLDGLERGIHVEGGLEFEMFHNTFVGAGTNGAARALSLNFTGVASSFSNNLVDNVIDPIGGGSSGITLRTGNMYSIDETSGGADRIVGPPNLDGSYAPQDPSDAMGAGDPSATIATAVGNVDHDGNSRPNPVATNPDIGAFETASVPVELTTLGLD